MRVKHPRLSGKDSIKLVKKLVEIKDDDEFDFIDEYGKKHTYTLIGSKKDEKNK